MAQNEKGGSDLDVFEGLGKKGGTSRPAPAPGTRSVPPPPPPSTNMRLSSPDMAKRTLLGIVAPSATTPPPPPPPIGSTPPAVLRTPPPPPGRSTLPPVVAPAPRPVAGSTAAVAQPPPPPSPAALAESKAAPEAEIPAPEKAVTAGVDVDWDDEDEATQIFDDHHELPRPAASSAPAFAAPSAPALGKSTLLGVTAPGFAGLPPPPAGGSSRAPSGVMLGRPGSLPAPGISSFPPPPMGSGFPPPPGTQPGLGVSGSPPRSSSPMHAAGHSVPAHLPMPSSFPRPAAVPDYLSPQPAMESTALVRPPPSRTGLYLMVGLALCAIITVAVLFGTPRTGNVLVNVTDAKGAGVNRVEIFVDGRKHCDTAPCRVEQLSTGQHEVKVLADGFDAPSVQSVTVESSKEATASFSLGAPKGGSSLRVAGAQPGVKLYIDDREIGPLPQEVRDLAPGDHTVRVAGSDRYQPLEKHVTIEKDQVDDLGTVNLKVLRGKATITLGTPSARVYLVSGADRRELPTLPISVDIDTTKTWSLEASRVGFEDFRQPISFDDGQAEKSFIVTLDARATPQYVPPPAQYVPPPAPAPAPAPAQAPAPAPVAHTQEAAGAEGGEAFLNINSIPPSTCFLDGRSLGSTPRVHVSVKAGAHSVKFINADQGLTKTISVTVGAGETKAAVTKLN